MIRELLLESPARINAILHRLADGNLKVAPGGPGLKELQETQRARNRHLYQATTGGALLLGGLWLLGLGSVPVWTAVLLAALGGALLLWGRFDA